MSQEVDFGNVGFWVWRVDADEFEADEGVDGVGVGGGGLGGWAVGHVECLLKWSVGVEAVAGGGCQGEDGEGSRFQHCC